jgi:hypothetical protein
VTWRQGVKQKLQSRFAAMRARPAHRDYWRSEPHPEEWLLIEWPSGESEPSEYWLSTLPPDMGLRELVHLAKHRWIIERDYQELKQELGLGHYEGRGWRGFSSSRYAMHRGLWIPGGRAESFFPQPKSVILDYQHPSRHQTTGRVVRRVFAPSGIIHAPSLP